MRYCPTCRTQYTDDTLRFCLQDGALLVERGQSDAPTAALDETPTVVRGAASRAGFGRQETETSVAAARARNDRSPILFPVIAVAALIILALAAGVVGTWLYLKSDRTIVPANDTAGTTNANSKNGDLTRSNPSPTPSRTAIASPPQVLDRERSSQEVSQVIDGWRAMTEAIDINSYMSNYADRIDYYNRRGLRQSEVRNDKARAFGMYRNMRIKLSDMNISVDENGTRATAEFDKEWDFRGPKNSSGKVRSQLHFRFTNNQWLIDGERDLRVYYIN